MSQPGPPYTGPPAPGPSAYGGYGGDLQDYGRSTAPTQMLPYDGPPLPPPMISPPSPVFNAPPPPTTAPPPSYQLSPYAITLPSPPQRPGVVGIAASMAVTASLQWVCALSFAWLVAVSAREQLGTNGPDSALFHIFNRFHYRMIDGLAWPLYLFPVASFTVGFVLLARRPWARVAFTVTGLGALAWSAWWLHANLAWWAAPALYIVVACLLVWTPGASQWYGWRARDQRPPG